MKKVCLLAAFLFASTVISCTSIDVALSKRVDITKKMEKIAIFPFNVKNAKWGDEFADSITHHFFKSGQVEVVEREAIQKILKEQKLSMTGAIDDSKAVQIGKLLGVDVILLGRGSALRLPTKSPEAENLIDTFSLKAISVETGSLLITVRKEPGVAWDWRYRMKYCCSLTLIWDHNDVLIQSSKYDDISKQIVSMILDSIKKLNISKTKKT